MENKFECKVCGYKALTDDIKECPICYLKNNVKYDCNANSIKNIDSLVKNMIDKRGWGMVLFKVVGISIDVVSIMMSFDDKSFIGVVISFAILCFFVCI